MSEQHVVIEPQRIVTPAVVLRPWSPDDAPGAIEIYGDPATAEAVGRREPVHDLAEMKEVLAAWNSASARRPVPQGRWAAEAADDGHLLGGATLLPFSAHASHLVMGWHLRPPARGRGLASHIGHALAHQAFVGSDVDEVFFVAGTDNDAGIAVARRLGMTSVDDLEWMHHGVRLHVLRLRRTDLHNIRPGISMDNSYDPDGLDDW